ncbi:DUF222 domain-containing protein, partial [Pseudarthrobacter sp. B907]|uniref:HNH endonuclease signature motif containing protein n=1 Tax=Pseudarthrobacter sp. B907 TaxID=3158261 RepID=UPI0032DB1375
MNTATNPRTRGTAAAYGAAPGGADDGSEGEEAADGFVPNVLDRRSRPQKHLDGLVGGCKVAMASGGLPATGGLRPQVMVTIDYRDLLERLHRLTDTGETGGGPTAGTDAAVGSPPPPTAEEFHGNATTGFTGDAAGSVNGAGPLGFTGTGTMAFTGPVTAATIRKIACDADIIPVLLGSKGRVLDIGRTTRVFPPHIRKAITARDRGCAFPGCTIPAPWCEAHHIDYWSRGGSTSTDNGTLLCSHHHHLIHKEEWTIEPHAGVPWFVPPPHLDPQQQPRRNHYFRS